MELIELDATAQRALELLTNAGMSDGSIYDYTHTGFGSILRHFHTKGILYNASLPSFAIHHQPLPSAAGVGVAGDKRQQVTPRLDFDFVHLVRLDDLHIDHGIGECFP